MEIGNFDNLNDNQMREVGAEILEHMMHPKNYGELIDAQGVGMGVNMETEQFVIVYINIENEKVDGIQFGANACQDAVVAGSLFTEMVKGDSLENAINTAKLMDEKLEVAPKRQQGSSRLVLRAFDAALKNRENKLNGIDEEMNKISIS